VPPGAIDTVLSASSVLVESWNQFLAVGDVRSLARMPGRCGVTVTVGVGVGVAVCVGVAVAVGVGVGVGVGSPVPWTMTVPVISRWVEHRNA
jgi:hypothetical protein